MHELSITSSVVDAVTESLRAYPGAKVLEVRLRVGALAAVVEDSLKFCWEIATEGTRAGRVAAGSDCGSGNGALRGVRRGRGTQELQDFRCPSCGEPASDVRGGRELEIESVEIEDAPEEVKR